ncbi:hypothetical protein ELI00_37040 [Rhizobium ruizarguesonis]|uniref:hypothetical protein n=1 Tax=Rhizobium ruizarguesonis TaxID=2081791 RepID=UPI0010313E7F|nr:hypothetical protein [Rhizobium ruizarguesonis]TAX63554.1 hypothetical protein ELI00_37040 [Rhizobium ruizarguesonis]
MPITKQGWELHVRRLGIQKKGAATRTYGTYQVYIDGVPKPELSGHICEAVGLGDNSAEDNGKRVEAETYPLWTQFGPTYSTIDYSEDLKTPGKLHMPGVLLGNTGKRTAILIHPGHPPKLYLSSIGCFNPTNPLKSKGVMDFWDSRTRVIALIDSLKAFAPNAFVHKVSTRIDGASVVVEGEPMNVLTDAMLADAALASLSAPPAAPVSSTPPTQIDLLAETLGALGRSGQSIAKLHVNYLDSTSLASVNVDFHPSTAAVASAAARAKELVLGEKVPNQSEVNVCGPIIKKIKRGDPEFAILVKNLNGNIEFKDEEGTGADRMMSARLRDGLNRLAAHVGAEWPGVTLRVTEAWDENNEHHGASLHYEGRAADVTTSPRDGDKLGRLGHLAVDAGLDWVFFEDSAHVHVSVKR